MRFSLISLFLILVLCFPVVAQTPSSRQETRFIRKAPDHQKLRPLSLTAGPLLTTKWGQGCFYNLNCPADPMAVNTCLHTPAGSGAIAMAQLMKYYGFPQQGTGEHNYTHPQYGVQYANFGATYYLWNGMPDSLTTSDPGVAMLIYHCGVGQDMNYGAQSSVSAPAGLDTALIKYFRYPATASRKLQSAFSVNDWKNMLKAEIDAGHPVLYNGSNYDGTVRRFFICDGYKDDDTFHINWGEGGMGNGWFTLYNLRFDTTNFSYDQQALFNLAPSPPTPTSVVMDFETIQDFSLSFNNWTVSDMDLHDTYAIQGFTFPHQNEPMAYLCFNPAATSPSMAGDAAIQPHGGQRFGACFSSNPPSNNDWFISPQVQMGTNGSFSFWIKSYNSTWGLDNYKVAVSVTDNNPASFTVISGAQPLQTTTDWTRKVFNLSAYNNQKVYVAIQCVSNDNFLMMIDDLEIRPEASTLLSADFTASKTSLRVGESINFTDQSAGAPISWAWTFQGGVPGTSTLQNPAGIKYNAPGFYAVKLKITNGLLSDSLIKEGYIEVIGYATTATLDFESLNDFTLDLTPWSTVDVNGGSTYGIQGVSFPGDYGPMAYICFNPSKTTPPLTNMLPHTGEKLGCCFSSTPPFSPNNKWLMSPKLSLGNEAKIEFWVKTYNNTWGYEQFRVGVSTSTLNPSDFTLLHVPPETAPVSWTKKSYSLSDYANQDVYVGIQCVTNNGFIFMIDDISISSSLGIEDTGNGPWFNVYPNPASNHLNLRISGKTDPPVEVKLVSLTGQLVNSWLFLTPQEKITLDVSSFPEGLYLLKTLSGDGESIRKISIIH